MATVVLFGNLVGLNKAFVADTDPLGQAAGDLLDYRADVDIPNHTCTGMCLPLCFCFHTEHWYPQHHVQK